MRSVPATPSASRWSPGTVATFSATIPPGRRRERHETEELLRREVEGHVRLAVRVDEDQVEAVVRAFEERAGRRR